MAKWLVEVEYTQRKTLTIYAPDEEAAGEKAAEIVESWQGVTYAEPVDVEPDE